MEEFLFLDGEHLKDELPLRSLFFGEGVFETFRWMGRPPVLIEKHLARMRSGARYLSIPCPEDEVIGGNLEDAISASGVRDAYVKVCLLSSGPLKFYERATGGHLLIVVRGYERPKNYMRVKVASSKRVSSSPILALKSFNYLENVIARRDAQGGGYDEAIFLNEREELTEGSSTNLFWIKEKNLFTPSLDCGLLPGITREALIQLGSEIGFSVRQGSFNIDDLVRSESAFLTNSLIGISAIIEINEFRIKVHEGIFSELRHSLFQELGWGP